MTTRPKRWGVSMPKRCRLGGKPGAAGLSALRIVKGGGRAAAKSAALLTRASDVDPSYSVF